VQALISLVDSTHAGDDEQTVATLRGAYAQTFQVGDVLALATARQFPDRFKDLKEWPPTSTERSDEVPTANLPASNLPTMALLVALALVTGVWTLRRLDRAASRTRATSGQTSRIE
jgi:hypothetical protein